MKTPRQAEALALAAIDRAARVDRNRADWWNMLPLRERQRAIGVAGMAKERAAEPLSSFSDSERRTVCLAISAHCAQMELIAHCMSGGPYLGGPVLH